MHSKLTMIRGEALTLISSRHKTSGSMHTLETIGHQLDRDIFPRVANGGIVMPDDDAVPQLLWAKEKKHETSRPRRPDAGTWTRTTGWQRSPDRRGPPRNPSSLVCSDLKAYYENGVTELQQAYPGTTVWYQPEGLWLMAESALLAGSCRRAVFLTGIPYVRTFTVRAWGFWVGIPFAHPVWIGPRHTNFHDGSICAFEPTDGTWMLGDSLTSLFDIYTCWAVRHLHLLTFGCWPGRQVVHHAYERILELKPGELCGCGSSRRYEECCRRQDLGRDLIVAANDFMLRTGGRRAPPESVKEFILGRSGVPNITDLLR